jgi:hypothetical protein
MKQEFSKDQALAVGLWIDGVPCNWDRTESVECLCINFPGLSGENGPLRLPVAVLPKRFLLKGKSFDDMLAVLAWSFTWLAQGKFPPKRHDGSSFAKDSWRVKHSMQPLGMSGFLCELRGDWAMLKDVFRFPNWSKLTGCCFKCSVVPSGIREFGSDASWRQPENRLSNWQFLARMIEQGDVVSPIFSCPGFHTGCVAIDWLHCCDLGVAQDFLGNLFTMLLAFQPGTNQTQRVSQLFLKIQKYYKDEHIQDKLDNLTELMIRKKASSSPKLRSKAAEARYLIKFAYLEATATLSDNDPMQQAAKQCAYHLHTCYENLSKSKFNADALKRESIRFCLLYGALEEQALANGEKTWRVKPKFHMWQELCSMGINPTANWVYRDEDFGGYLAASSRKKGGPHSVKSTGESTLNKFRSKHQPYLK